MSADFHNKLRIDKEISLNTLIAILSFFGGIFFFLERFEDKILTRIMFVIEQKEKIAAETHRGLDERITSNKAEIDRLRITVDEHTKQIAMIDGRRAETGVPRAPSKEKLPTMGVK